MTVSHPAFGTATSTIARAVPPPMEELFNLKGMKETTYFYHYGKKLENVKDEGMWNALDPENGAMVRMYGALNPKWCPTICCNNIIVNWPYAGNVSETKPYQGKDFPGSPVQGFPYGWAATLKISENSHYVVGYNAYNIGISTILSYKTIPKK